jgi:hypothetical protein
LHVGKGGYFQKAKSQQAATHMMTNPAIALTLVREKEVFAARMAELRKSIL